MSFRRKFTNKNEREWYRDGIIHGTTPEDEEYWGDMFDFDQKMVEAPAVAFSMLLNEFTPYFMIDLCFYHFHLHVTVVKISNLP